MNRRQFLIGTGALVASGLVYAGNRFWPDSGFSNPCLSSLPPDLRQHPLMQEIWQGLDTNQVWDCHVHLTGTGDSGEKLWFNPAMDSWLHPILRAQKHFYMNGGCVDENAVDVSYAQRLLSLTQDMPAGFKSMLLAFDYLHDETGMAMPEQSIFYVGNNYAAKLAQQHPQHFEWVASIHPYRKDAIDALEQAKAQGARAIKWLPSGMNIDPASPKCDAFYRKAAQLNLPIISHTGRESAVQGGDQSFGNPLRMRRALDAGVRVVLAHCASDGYDDDTDNGNRRVKSFELFGRLMDTPAYQDLLFGEISAFTLINHAWVIKPLLARTDWQYRLLNGSDYPLPGIFPLINLHQLVDAQLLDVSHVAFLQTLKNHNALLFDFAIKRLIRHEGRGFANRTFETRRFFDARH